MTDDRAGLQRRILALLPHFDPVIDALAEPAAAVLAMSHRAVHLSGAVHREAAYSTSAANVLLRALVDLLIVVRWVELCPRLHARLWLVNDDVERIKAIDALTESLRAKGRAIPDSEVPSAARRAIAKRRHERLRRIAIALQVGPARDSLLPTIRRRAQLVPGLERELYDEGLAVLSPVAHSGQMSFVITHEAWPDGRRMRLGDQVPGSTIANVADSMLCGILASTSRQLGLGVEDALDEIRMELVSRPELG